MELAKLLLNAGADIEEMPYQLDMREPGPYTALYQAVLGQQVEMIRFLLERGAKVDTPCGRAEDTALKAGQKTG
jgi:ankyrin repeat protein